MDMNCLDFKFVVRLSGAIGHELLWFRGWCPIERCYRTWIALISSLMSDWAVLSDMDCFDFEVDVQLSGAIGHGLLW